MRRLSVTMALAAGMDVANETDCTGGATHAVWQFVAGKVCDCSAHGANLCNFRHLTFSPELRLCGMLYFIIWAVCCVPQPPPAHPQTWNRPSDVTADLIDKLRVPAYAKAGCNASAAISSANVALPAAAATATGVIGNSGGGAMLGIQGAVDDVKTHFSQVLQQMPQPVQRLMGDFSSIIMRRMCAHEGEQHGQQMSRRHLLRQTLKGSAWRHGSQQSQRQHFGQAVVSSRSGVAATTEPRHNIRSGSDRQLAQAWEGESWLLDDPFRDSADGPEVQQLVEQYAALGHACPLFARKFTGAVAPHFANIARQHILLP
jgi:hypothetical protein